MPAMFDPVRDAVANSPRTPSYPLPSPSPTTTSHPLHAITSTPSNQASQSTSFPFPPLHSTATAPSLSLPPPHDLPPRPPPPSKRPSSLSMLLNGEEPPAKNLRLASLMSPATADAPLPPPPPFSTGDRRPGSSSSSTSSQPPHPLRSVSSPSPTHSVSPSRPQPPLAKMATTSTTSAGFTRPKLPYHPVRITPPDSVLRPLTETDFASWVSQNPLRNLPAARSRRDPESPLGKRPRESENRPEGEPLAKRSKDVGSIVQHYNARPDVGVDKRQESPIIGLKSFNNWVKSVLISKFAGPAFRNTPNAPPHPSGRATGRGKVLDMGCGKGGDLQKWSKAKVAEYVGVDIAAQSVDQAYHRWLDMQSRKGSPVGKFSGAFATLDCYVSPLVEATLPRAALATQFDAVSLQFCVHYAFETEFKARTMLDNVSRYLRLGGVFIGTVPNDQQLMERLAEQPDDDLSWGNSVYKFLFDDKVKRTYGQRYSFTLQDAVDDVPEYVVHWDNFQRLAASYGLRQIWKEEFHEVYENHKRDKEFGPLLQRMKVVDAVGESHMDEQQWEAANVYVAFAFEKVAPFTL